MVAVRLLVYWCFTAAPRRTGSILILSPPCGWGLTGSWTWSETDGYLGCDWSLDHSAVRGDQRVFRGGEFALVAVRRTRVEEMVAQGQAGDKAVEAGVTNLDRSIAATQLGITLASIALGWIGEPAVAALLEPVIAVVPEAWRGATAHSIAFGFGFLLITFLHVVFGELIPKTVALQIPDRAALWVATPLVMFARIARPLIFLMNGTGNTVLRLIGFQPASGREMVHSVEELALLIEDTEEAGILSETQADVVQKVFRLSAKRVRDCMVPRRRWPLWRSPRRRIKCWR